MRGGSNVHEQPLRRSAPAHPTMPRGTHLKALKKLVGVVVSTGMDRTAVVAVPRLRLHPLVRRFVRQLTKYFCHDHHEICGVGDKVQIRYCGQVSKKKHWAVIDMVERHPQLGGEPFPMSRLSVPPATATATAAAAAEGAPLR